MTNREETKQLKQSALFNISLCSKELSHSNFWAWLIEKDIEGTNPFIEIFFPGFYSEGNTFSSVEREKKHADLTIWYKNSVGNQRCILIENKIKSIPTIEQLIRYQAEYSNVIHSGILTGISDSLDLSSLTKWKFKSYSEIVSDIRRINEDNKDNIQEFDYNLIENYCTDVCNIVKLLEDELHRYNNQYIIKPNSDLEELRFGDVLLKLNAAMFKKYLDHRIEEDSSDLQSDFGKPEVSIGFSDKRSTVTIVYMELFDSGSKNNKGKEEKGRVGIQIQGGQFRIYAGPSFKKSKYLDKDKLFKYLSRLKWFEAYDKKEQKIRNMPSGMTKNYCKYEKENDYLHIYQYWKITDFGFEHLYDEIKKELMTAKKLINEGKVHF